MPAVANKVDKVASSDVNNNSTAGAELKKGKMDPGAATSDNSQVDPVKTAGQIIEKKVRNLEKRKARLLELKGEEDKGKQLQPEQKEAVKKLDNVIELVDTLKEIKKNVTDSLTDVCFSFLFIDAKLLIFYFSATSSLRSNRRRSNRSALSNVPKRSKIV